MEEIIFEYCKNMIYSLVAFLILFYLGGNKHDSSFHFMRNPKTDQWGSTFSTEMVKVIMIPVKTIISLLLITQIHWPIVICWAPYLDYLILILTSTLCVDTVKSLLFSWMENQGTESWTIWPKVTLLYTHINMVCIIHSLIALEYSKSWKFS